MRVIESAVQALTAANPAITPEQARWIIHKLLPIAIDGSLENAEAIKMQIVALSLTE